LDDGRTSSPLKPIPPIPRGFVPEQVEEEDLKEVLVVFG